jgi:predicted dehydrogenase
MAVNRRNFVISALSASRILGANDRIRMGLIGCGGRGRYVAKCIRDAGAGGLEYVAVSDVSRDTMSAAKEWAGNGAQEHPDFRRMLDQKDIDAVHVATPDHWHAIPTVMACAAGKDVYVEKPLAHNIREGQAMVAASRKYNRIVVAGTQHRSAIHFPEVARMVQSGELGKVRYVRVWNFINMLPNGIGHAADADTPAGVDWDLYLGPAPKRPFNSLRFQRTFRWFWDYAGGFITDFGTHRFDTVHQIMGADQPKTVSASGGRFELKDDGQMPDIMQVTYEYPEFVLSYEACLISAHGLGGRTAGMRYYNQKGTEDRPHGMAFYGTNGAIFADRIGYDVYPDNNKIERKHVNAPEPTPLHAKHFVETLRTRKPSYADVATGHRSTIIPHLGNIAYKTGQKLHWDAAQEQFKNAPEANRMLTRDARKPWDMLA